jgi:hypothetical protein
MKSGRRVLVALALIGTLTMTACGTTSATVTVDDGSAGSVDDSPAASPSPAADPVAVLTASITRSKDASLKYTISSRIATVTTDGVGEVDAATHSESLTMAVASSTRSVHEQITVLGTDMYLKMDVPIQGADATKWIHLDLARLRSLASLGFSDPWDPTNLSAYGKDLITVQQSSPGQFQGTVDITKAPLPSLTSALLAQFGDAFKAIPFQATTDDEGRLTSLTIQMPALGADIPASTTKMTFSDFGTPVHVQAPPAAQTQEAPDAVYQLFGG